MNTRRCMRLLAATLLAANALASGAAEAGSERERIDAERARVEAGFAQREQECRRRFVVTSCVEDARRERRRALERLRGQQEVLDEAQRKQRAAQRLDAIRAKVSGEEARQRDAAAKARREDRQSATAAPRSAPASAPAPVIAGAAASASSSAHARAPAHTASHAASAAAAQNVAEREKRLQQARAHRAEVERRHAERAAQGKVAAKPLPVPAAPSAPSQAGR